MELMAMSLSRSQSAPGDLDKKLHEVRSHIYLMSKQLKGDPLRKEVGEKSLPTIGDRVSVATMGTERSSYGPTKTHAQSLTIAEKQLKEFFSVFLGQAGLDALELRDRPLFFHRRFK